MLTGEEACRRLSEGRDEAVQPKLPDKWSSKGCMLMSSEVVPEAAKKLKVAVQQQLHPDAAPVVLMRSPAPTKMWAELDVLLHEPQVSHGPSQGPAINLISMVVSGLSPPSAENPHAPKPKPLMAWDQVRNSVCTSV